MEKICPKCKVKKELSEDNFYKSNQTKSGFKCYCKICVNKQNKEYDNLNKDKLKNRILKSRNRNEESKKRHYIATTKHRNNNIESTKSRIMQRKYNIDLDYYNNMFQKQNGCCEICSKELVYLGKATHIDHCHSSNKVRGLLCNSCNLALGHFKDNVKALAKAIEYLNKNSYEEDNSYQPKCNSSK